MKGSCRMFQNSFWLCSSVFTVWNLGIIPWCAVEFMFRQDCNRQGGSDEHEPWLSEKYVVLASQQTPVAAPLQELKVRSQGDCRPDRAWFSFEGRKGRETVRRKTVMFYRFHFLCGKNFPYVIYGELFWRQEPEVEIYMMMIILLKIMWCC